MKRKFNITKSIDVGKANTNNTHQTVMP